MKNTSKGVKDSVKETLTPKEFKSALRGKLIRRNVRSIKSKTHRLVTLSERRIAISSFDCKRQMLSCGVHSLAWGSKEKVNNCDSFFAPCT